MDAVSQRCQVKAKQWYFVGDNWGVTYRHSLCALLPAFTLLYFVLINPYISFPFEAAIPDCSETFISALNITHIMVRHVIYIFLVCSPYPLWKHLYLPCMFPLSFIWKHLYLPCMLPLSFVETFISSLYAPLILYLETFISSLYVPLILCGNIYIFLVCSPYPLWKHLYLPCMFPLSFVETFISSLYVPLILCGNIYIFLVCSPYPLWKHLYLPCMFPLSFVETFISSLYAPLILCGNIYIFLVCSPYPLFGNIYIAVNCTIHLPISYHLTNLSKFIVNCVDLHHTYSLQSPVYRVNVCMSVV